MAKTQFFPDDSKVSFLNQEREIWIKKSKGYYLDILRLVSFFSPPKGSVLEVGCSTGWILRNMVSGIKKAGVERRADLLKFAKQSCPEARLIEGDFEKPDFDLKEKFDFIIASDVVPFVYDVQNLLESCRRHLNDDGSGRVLLTCYNPYLKPLYKLAEIFGLKSPSKPENWITVGDIHNLSDLVGYEVIRSGYRALVPWDLLGLGRWINRWIAPIPVFRFFNLYYYALLRPRQSAKNLKTVSVIVPARNEAGNIRAARDRLPRLSETVELIYVEGNSTDNTWSVIQEVLQEPKPEWMTIRAYKQRAKGKADAVHLGFAEASGDVLAILDADLTVPPEDLPRFIEPLRSGVADFTHGDRLTYPMEGEAMQFLNMIANKFFGLSFSFILGQTFKDTLCGTKVFWREDWAKILELRKFFGDFDPFGDFEMIFGSIKLNHRVLQIPIHYKARTYGETNIRRWHHGWILLKMLGFAAPRMKFF